MSGKRQSQLNRTSPANNRSKLGDVIADLITNFNVLLATLTARTATMLSTASLAIHGASSPLVKSTTAFAAIIAGVAVRKAAGTDMAALSGTLATAKSALWAFYIDGTGTLSSAKTADAASHDAALLLLPAVPAGKAMIGFIVVDNASGSNFVGGTTALDTGSVTVTYYNCTDQIPVGPTITAAAITDLESR